MKPLQNTTKLLQGVLTDANHTVTGRYKLIHHAIEPMHEVGRCYAEVGRDCVQEIKRLPRKVGRHVGDDDQYAYVVRKQNVNLEPLYSVSQSLEYCWLIVALLELLEAVRIKSMHD